MGIIEINHYPVFIKIGCFPEEQLAGHHVEVSLRIHLNPFSAKDDLLDSTLDYSLVIKEIDTVLLDRSYKLIESAVQTLGQHMIGSFKKIHHVEVKIKKTRVPGGILKGASISYTQTFHRG